MLNERKPNKKLAVRLFSFIRPPPPAFGAILGRGAIWGREGDFGFGLGQSTMIEAHSWLMVGFFERDFISLGSVTCPHCTVGSS